MPGAWGSRRSSTIRSMCAMSARTRASSSAALLTAIALCPACSSAARNRSRTNAVSSATMTVLAVTEVLAIWKCIGVRCSMPQAALQFCAACRYNPNVFVIATAGRNSGTLATQLPILSARDRTVEA